MATGRGMQPARFRAIMSYHGAVALFVCSLSVVLSSFALQFISSALPERDRGRGVPAWLLATAVFLLVVVVWAASSSRVANGAAFPSLSLTAVMLAGVFCKWLCETIAQKKYVLHESVLAQAMLVAPLMVVWFGHGVFTANLTPATFVLWFLNGYFWHAFFSDIERITTREKIVIRRREPPTLPYDYRKPTID